jgi:hypothetical protein
VRLWALGKLQTDDDDDDPTPDDELDEAAAAFGLRVEHESLPDERSFFLLPDGVDSWVLWTRLQTQWRTAGVDGARSGLDYAGVRAFMLAHGYGSGKRRSERRALGDIQVMEATAMNVWAAQQKQNARRRHG